MLKSELNLNVLSTQISTAHRLGAKPANQTSDRRSFIMKLCRRDLKRDILAASKRIKNPRIFVNENLTPNRRRIFQTLRKVKRENPSIVKTVTTYEGKVIVYTKNNSSEPNARDVRHIVNNGVSLSLFCENQVKKPLELFLENFDRQYFFKLKCEIWVPVRYFEFLSEFFTFRYLCVT